MLNVLKVLIWHTVIYQLVSITTYICILKTEYFPFFFFSSTKYSRITLFLLLLSISQVLASLDANF